MRYAVILAGGSGQRLWPLSRQNQPKQLLPLISGKSLLQMAVDRLLGDFKPENILVVTGAEYADQAADAVKTLPRDNIVGEPMGRDTAAAIGLGAAVVAQRDPDATMGVFTADHVIRPKADFQRCVDEAFKVAEDNSDALVTFGIKPTWPHTGLGYIHRSEKLYDAVYRVQGFREKPDHSVARRYVESGEYYWNSGMFVWKVSTILEALEKFLPDSAGKIRSAVKAPNRQARLAEVYPTLEKISIDFAVMEKADNVLVVELGCEWLDVGSWPNLAEVSEIDKDGNAIAAAEAALLDSERNVIVSGEDGHLIALLGVDDCVVVHSQDATLVCNKNESQRLKELVALIREKYGDRHL